mmetsp:Transcript_33112/g.54678  ORF Transcript_33112/g.54678 Transcript_33112/m.54678 type:complete len:234 (+) Transcript_33112:369-1070(+)
MRSSTPRALSARLFFHVEDTISRHVPRPATSNGSILPAVAMTLIPSSIPFRTVGNPSSRNISFICCVTFFFTAFAKTLRYSLCKLRMLSAASGKANSMPDTAAESVAYGRSLLTSLFRSANDVAYAAAALRRTLSRKCFRASPLKYGSLITSTSSLLFPILRRARQAVSNILRSRNSSFWHKYWRAGTSLMTYTSIKRVAFRKSCRFGSLISVLVPTIFAKRSKSSSLGARKL